MSLSDWQVEVNGVVTGADTDYKLSAFDYSEPEVRSSDAPIPRGDGIRFGRDYYSGCTVALEWSILGSNASEVRDNYSALRAAWYSATARHDPGAVDSLRYKLPGQDTRRIFGRGRKFSAATLENAQFGLIPVAAQFDTVDHRVYSDAEFNETFSFVPPSTGGVSAPVSAPVFTTGIAEGIGEIFVGGEDATWLTMRIYGPIVNPIVEVTNFWTAKLLTTLAVDQYVDIDPRPWSRSVLRNDGASLAGVFASSSPRLSQMALTPGNHEIVLRGTSSSGNASLNVWWRNAYLSL